MTTPANVIVAFLVSLALAGCASSGNQSIADATGETVSSQLVKGRTHQTEVRRLYGDPIKTSFASNGNESWEYEFSRMQSKVTNFTRLRHGRRMRYAERRRRPRKSELAEKGKGHSSDAVWEPLSDRAVISGLVPTMFMTRVRFSGRSANLTSTFGTSRRFRNATLRVSRRRLSGLRPSSISVNSGRSSNSHH